MRTPIIIATVCCVMFSPGYGVTLSSAQTENTTAVQQVLRIVLNNNSALQAAKSRWQAAIQHANQKAYWPEPVFSYTRFFESIETRVGPQKQAFSLSQAIPVFGTPNLQKKVDSRNAEMLRLEYESLKNDIILDVKRICFDIYEVRKSQKILDEYLEILREFRAVAEQKYTTGQGIQADVLKAQLEISTLLERKLRLEKQNFHLLANLKALTEAGIDSIDFTEIKTDSFDLSIPVQNLTEKALKHNEKLGIDRTSIMKSRDQRKIAKRSYLPAFRLQANYIDISEAQMQIAESGKDAWSFTLGMTLPIWFGKQKAAVREADELRTASQKRAENTQNEIIERIDDLVFQLKISDQNIELYEHGMIAQAQSSLTSAISSYRTGNLDFLNLLDAERMVLTVRLNYLKERVNHMKLIAELERTVGLDADSF